jgi:methyl coenzyme M reductase subunit C-like uncharacterized protein (methanogenesis marker protein 7)
MKGRKTRTSKKERRESRYNREYERCMTEDIPEYLRRESARKRKMMGRFRGERKQVLDGRKGKNDEERKTIEHMWNG